jgi:hypothetical protein
MSDGQRKFSEISPGLLEGLLAFTTSSWTNMMKYTPCDESRTRRRRGYTCQNHLSSMVSRYLRLANKQSNPMKLMALHHGRILSKMKCCFS